MREREREIERGREEGREEERRGEGGRERERSKACTMQHNEMEVK